jgi:hypothetical protein
MSEQPAQRKRRKCPACGEKYAARAVLPALRLVLFVIPLGMGLKGGLLICGVHPKDFYTWWNDLSDTVQYIIWGILGVVGLAVLYLLSFI